MILAILQSDNFVVFFLLFFSQPEQITLFALRHSAFRFSLLRELRHSNQRVLDNSQITDYKQQESHKDLSDDFQHQKKTAPPSV